MWMADIDRNSSERQYAYRSKYVKLWGGPVDEEIRQLEGEIEEIIKENPGVTREKIQLSTECMEEPYDDYPSAYICLLYYTPETDEEWKDRVAVKNQEVETLKNLIAKYPNEAKATLEEK